MYFTVKDRGSSEYIEKKSVFKGVISRCVSEEDAKQIIANVKAENHNARHNVYAYIIGKNGDIKRYSDDGEPQGTGGIPLLSVLEKNNLKDVVIIVTRYFGGILLGASGLSRAYGKAAGDAVASVDIISVVPGEEINLAMAYDVHSRIDRFLRDEEIQIVESDFTEEVNIIVRVKSEDAERLIENIKEISLNRVIFGERNKKEYFLSPSGILDEIDDKEQI